MAEKTPEIYRKTGLTNNTVKLSKGHTKVSKGKAEISKNRMDF